jgi:SAM-dependent methyltransferase
VSDKKAEESDRDTVGRFNNRAADYVRYRPTYPPEAIDAILDGLGPPGRIVAADVGAGTGISARLLGERGVRVIAVEPGEVMRRAARAHPNVVWAAGRAEATGLASQAVDLVLCAQSFHWFQTADALLEFARILKERGRLAITWNRRSTSDPFTAGYRQAIVDVGGEIAEESRAFDPNVISDSGLFSSPERQSFPNFQRLDLAGLIGRARSASYVPRTGVEGERLLSLLRALHERYADEDGLVTLVYDTEVFCANPGSDGALARRADHTSPSRFGDVDHITPR